MRLFCFPGTAVSVKRAALKEPAMQKEDSDIFREAVGDVVPLPETGARLLPSRSKASPLAEQMRRAAAEAKPGTADDNPLTLPTDIILCDPHDIGGEKKNGVQEGVYRKLRLGHYTVQDSIDLHRLSLKDARVQVHVFLKTAHQHGLRTLLVTHGKGTTAVLKSHTWHWLAEHPLVLAWHSAPAKLGGAGATLVLIRKNAQTSR